MFQVDDDSVETVRDEEIGREGLRKEKREEEKSPSHGSVVQGAPPLPVTSWSLASDDGGDISLDSGPSHVTTYTT